AEARLAAVDRVADLERVPAPAQPQADLGGAVGQLADRPARLIGGDHGAEAHPAVEVLDAGLDPVPLVYSHHGAGLVVLGGEGAAQSQRQVEVPGSGLTVEVAAVAHVAVAGGAPEIRPGVGGDRQ